ncbi:MAG: hypothetical protein IPO34_12730 [Dehalococcoidia bacterium]|nr:hypothetical protein [Dehalococcoidia bacterium]
MQRPQADFDPAGDDGVELQDWDAELVDLLVVLSFDRGLDLLHGVDGDVRVELTADGDVVAVGGNVDTVRALRFRRQVEDAFGNRDIHRDDAHAVNRLRLARDDLFGLLPVDDVHHVEVVGGGADFERLSALVVAAEGHLGVVGVDEHPTIADELAGIGEVLGVRRQLDLEALGEIHAPGLLIDLEEG